MIKIGFELEAFCLKDKPILVPTELPYDECGWLVEVRSEPHTDVEKAVHLLLAEKKVVEAKARELEVSLLFEPLLEIPRDLKVQAARLHTKGLISYRNLYEHETHKCSTRFATASLHISFTNERCFNYKKHLCCAKNHTEEQVFKYQGFIDHAKYIVALDKAFKSEISKAKRNPGFYEIKSDGRIEYRSLPNNIDLDKLSNVLTDLLK